MGSIVNKYLHMILKATTETGIYAYRGQSNSQWPLHSGATRRLIDEHGEELLRDPEFPQLFIAYHQENLLEPARARGFGSDSGHQLSDLELLAKLQHFEAKTGLLDFSWSPLVALWFACHDSSREGRLFMININDPLTIARVHSQEGAQKVDIAFLHPAGEPLLAYWEPPVVGDASARILRQRSVFLIGRPLLTTSSELVEEITIDREDKRRLARELEILDFSQDSLFQDVYGFAKASNLKSVPQLTAEAQIRKGNRHFQKQDYVEALAAYSKSIELSPHVGLTYLLRGNTYAALHQHKEAKSDYDRAEQLILGIDLGTRDTVYFNRGNSKSELRDYEGAIQDYSQAVDLNPGLVQAYFNRANTYLDLLKFEEALHDYDHIIGKEAQNVYFNKANALLALGRLSDARKSYQESIEKGESSENAVNNLAVVDQIIALIDGAEFKTTSTLDSNAEFIELRFNVSGNPKYEGQLPRTFLFAGRIGNTGNTGGPSLKGGKGLGGKNGGFIHISFLQ